MERRSAVEASIDACNRAFAAAAQKAAYLCGECAENMKAKWPRGHRATFHTATCPFCKCYRPIASWDDWNWPQAPEFNRLAQQTREA